MRSFVPSLLLILCGVVTSTLARAATIEPVGQASQAQSRSAYRFVLRDPQAHSKPYRHGPYKIVLRSGALTEGGATVVHGTTDRTGRTALLLTQQPLEDGQWQVTPVVGQGDNSETFTFVDQDTNEPLADIPYVIDTRNGGLYCGYSDEQGMTVQINSPVSTTVSAKYLSSLSDCSRLRQKVAHAMNARSASETVRRLEALAKRYESSNDYAALLQEKADGVVLSRGSAAQVQALMDRKLQMVDMAVAYNHIAYTLIDQHPPRHLSLAHGYLQRAYALAPDAPYLLDSLAWALHLMKRESEALTQIDASIAAFAQVCNADDLVNRQIAYSHRASILWSLGRRDEALDHWAMASQAGTASNWSAGLDYKLVNEHIARRAKGQPATDLCQASSAGEPSGARH